MATSAQQDFVPAAGRAWLTGTYDAVIALSARESKLRGGMLGAIDAATAGQQSARVLELGCGTGSLSIAIARALPGAEVCGVDLDPEALAIANSKPGAEAVRWLEGNATDAPPEAGSWDCVAISLVLHHLTPEQQPQALARAHEALRLGGTLHVIDFGVPHGPLPKLGWPLLQKLDGVTNTSPLGNGELPGMIDAAGFTGRRLVQRFGTVWGTHEQYAATR